MGRRRILAGVAGLASMTVVPGAAMAHAPASDLGGLPLPAERRLNLLCLQTGDRVSAAYVAEGRYVSGAIREIEHLLRDWRRNEARPIDRRLLDLLFVLQQKLGTATTFEVVSGYRSPETNAELAARNSEVAKQSQHMAGKAVDIAMKGPALMALHAEALSLKAGGVGLYSKSSFIHLDTGTVRHWER